MSETQGENLKAKQPTRSSRHAALPGSPLTADELKEEIRIGDESGIAEGDVFARARSVLRALDHTDRNIAA